MIGEKANSSPLSAVYMRRWTVSTLFQIMACHLNSAKPLSKPMLKYCQLDPKENITMKFNLKLKYFHSRKCIWTCHLWNGSHFVRGRWVNFCLAFQFLSATPLSRPTFSISTWLYAICLRWRCSCTNNLMIFSSWFVWTRAQVTRHQIILELCRYNITVYRNTWIQWNVLNTERKGCKPCWQQLLFQNYFIGPGATEIVFQ